MSRYSQPTRWEFEPWALRAAPLSCTRGAFWKEKRKDGKGGIVRGPSALLELASYDCYDWIELLVRSGLCYEVTPCEELPNLKPVCTDHSDTSSHKTSSLATLLATVLGRPLTVKYLLDFAPQPHLRYGPRYFHSRFHFHLTQVFPTLSRQDG